MDKYVDIPLNVRADTPIDGSHHFYDNWSRVSFTIRDSNDGVPYITMTGDSPKDTILFVMIYLKNTWPRSDFAAMFNWFIRHGDYAAAFYDPTKRESDIHKMCRLLTIHCYDHVVDYYYDMLTTGRFENVPWNTIGDIILGASLYNDVGVFHKMSAARILLPRGTYVDVGYMALPTLADAEAMFEFAKSDLVARRYIVYYLRSLLRAIRDHREKFLGPYPPAFESPPRIVLLDKPDIGSLSIDLSNRSFPVTDDKAMLYDHLTSAYLGELTRDEAYV